MYWLRPHPLSQTVELQLFSLVFLTQSNTFNSLQHSNHVQQPHYPMWFKWTILRPNRGHCQHVFRRGNWSPQWLKQPSRSVWQPDGRTPRYPSPICCFNCLFQFLSLCFPKWKPRLRIILKNGLSNPLLNRRDHLWKKISLSKGDREPATVAASPYSLPEKKANCCLNDLN